MTMEKEELRKEILKKRMNLSDKEVSDKSLKITDSIINLKEYKKSLLIMCYVDFKKEVSTKVLIKQALLTKKRISVPLITGSLGVKNSMIASEILCFEKDLEVGKYGIYEPKSECIKQIEPKEIDFVIVPGVAFDLKRNRIGYGAGYYDRFLRLLRPDCLKVGVAFEEQLIKEVPINEFDVALDMLITNQRII